MDEELFDKATSGELTEPQLRQLDKLLSDDEIALQAFLNRCQLEIDLHVVYGGIRSSRDGMKRSEASDESPESEEKDGPLLDRYLFSRALEAEPGGLS